MALVLPVLMAIFGGMIQFGLIFWSQNSLNQIVRDTGRYAATLQDCSATAPVISKANALATQASLFAYTAGSWTSTNVAVTWPANTDVGHTTDPCPPANNQQVRWVRITVQHTVPIFFPLIPVSGNLSSSAEFRMEPSA
jgi:Flp pilus assembly protein TadG